MAVIYAQEVRQSGNQENVSIIEYLVSPVYCIVEYLKYYTTIAYIIDQQSQLGIVQYLVSEPSKVEYLVSASSLSKV